MAAAGIARIDIVDQQLAALQQERSLYIERIAALMKAPGRSSELEGYLRLVENVNEAAIRLARSAERIPLETAA